MYLIDFPGDRKALLLHLTIGNLPAGIYNSTKSFVIVPIALLLLFIAKGDNTPYNRY